MASVGRYAGRIFIGLLACLFAGGAFYAQFAADDKPGPNRTNSMLAGTLFAMGAVGLGSIEAFRAERARHRARIVSRNFESALYQTLSVSLAPATRYLAELSAAASPSEKSARLGDLRATVMAYAVALTAPPQNDPANEGARCALYLLDSSGTRLVRQLHSGRALAPRATFDLSSPDGLEMKKVLDTGVPAFFDGTPTRTKRFPPSDPHHDYESVIAVAVEAQGSRYGLLCIDAPKKGELTATHVAFVRVLANLLGAGYAQV